MSKEEITKTIGTRIAALRHSRGVSAAEFAESLGLTMWRMTRIENGTSELSAAELVAVAAELKVTTSVLTGEEKFSHFMDRIETAQAAAAGAQ